ncbi:MAG: hypothetical protein AAFV59_09380 [Pseudomonadota bacterium]
MILKTHPNLSQKALISGLTRMAEAAGPPVNNNSSARRDASLAFLKRTPSLEFDHFLDKLSSGPKTMSQTTKPKSELREDVVKRHSDALKTAGYESKAFESALSNIETDREVRLLELKHIAEAYIGAAQRFKTKTLGLKIIEQTFDQRWKLEMRRS